VYDALQARTIGVGGGQSWAIGAPDFTAWTAPLVRLSGGPAGPGPVDLVFDPRRGRTVAFDGAGTWELDGDAWVFTAPAPPACPGGHLLFDPAAGTLLKLAGGGCDLACWYDGAWTCGAAQAPDANLAGAPDPAEGVLLAQGAGSRTWIRDGAVPHDRTAAQSASVRLPPGATPLGADVTVTASRQGSQLFGFELSAWDWAGAAWAPLGSTQDPAALALTLERQLPTDPAPFFRDGRLWLQVVPLGPPAPLYGARQSRLKTSEWTLEVEYLLP
jgi:hypothetical protein